MKSSHIKAGINSFLVIAAMVFFSMGDSPSYAKKTKPVIIQKSEIPGEEDYKFDASYDYSAVDRYALSAGAADEQSLDTLSKYLTGAGKGDRERCRAIYTWITERIVYDMEAVGAENRPDQSAPAVLKNRKGVCQGISNLFHELAKRVNLVDRQIYGYSKGFDYRPGEKITDMDHVWNCVKIEGKWRFIEATWGCGVFERQSKRIVKSNPGFWFFARPEHMIYAHLPAEQAWTLLDRTVSIGEFEAMANLSQSFFELGYDESSLDCRTFVIKTPGRFSVTLKGGRGELGADLLHSSGLYLQEYEPFPVDTDGSAKKIYVRCTDKGGISVAEAEIPESGTYELRLFSVIKENKSDRITASIYEIVSYRVVVDSGNITESKDLAEPVTLYDEFARLGFYESGLSHKNYGIRADRNIRLTLQGPRDIQAVSLMEHDGVEIKELTFTQCKDGMITVDCTFPSDGIYNMRIFAKKRGDMENYRGIAAYRFYAKGIQQDERRIFPQTYGVFLDMGACLIMPMTGYLKKGSLVEFSIEVPGALDVAVYTGGNRVKLKNTGGNLFSGKVKVKGKSLSICGMFKKGSGYPMLVKYEVY